MSTGERGSPGASRRRPVAAVANILKVAFAIALLFLVVRTVPWTDEILWTVASERRQIPGAISGDWKAEAVAFRIARGFTPDPSWPADVRGALSGGTQLVLTRSADDPLVTRLGGAIDWRPGMPKVFREMEPGGLVFALSAMLIALFTVITRWWRLLAVADCPTPYWRVLRLSFLGLFFNIVVPGLTGGDLVKAVLVVRENPAQRAKALMTVLVDRIIGLLVLAALAAAMILALGSTFADIRLPVLLFLGGGVLGALAYSSRSVRRMIGFDALLERLPLSAKLKKLDEALFLYSRRPGELVLAVGLSLANHVLVICAVFALGRAFGDALPFAHYLALVPVANIASSLPIAPGGWGVGEAAYGFLFKMVGASGTIGVAVSVTFRLLLMVFGLAGGIFLLVPGTKADLKEIKGLELSS